MNPRAIVLSLGSEVVSGSVQDTNASYIARKLTESSFNVVAHGAIRDDFSEIEKALSFYLPQCDVLIVSGGLGPTFDDITKGALARFFGRPIVRSRRQLARIRAYFKKRRKTMGRGVEAQAHFPSGAHLFDNDHGVAPGFAIADAGRCVIAVPGVPSEMKGMIDREVIPFLNRRHPCVSCETLTARMAGISEVEVLRKLTAGFPPKETECGIYPLPGEVIVKMKFMGSKTSMRRAVSRWKRIFQAKLKDYLIGFSDETIEVTVGRLLTRSKATVVTAESLTGGLIAKRLTDVPGSSAYFKGAYVAYQDDVKSKILHVAGSILKKRGAVSRAAAQAMASSARIQMKSDWSVAATGVAGPGTKGSREPVGTVFVAVEGPRYKKCERMSFHGNRERIRTVTSLHALRMLWQGLLSG